MSNCFLTSIEQYFSYNHDKVRFSLSQDAIKDRNAQFYNGTPKTTYPSIGAAMWIILHVVNMKLF